MSERKYRLILTGGVLFALFLPCPGPLVFYIPYWLLKVKLIPSLICTSLDDAMFLVGVELPFRVYLLTIPVLVLMNLCLAGFTRPWLRRLYRVVLLVLWGSFLILLPRRSAEIFIIPLTLAAVTVTEFVLVRKGYFARWDSAPVSAPNTETPDGDNQTEGDVHGSMK